MSYLLYFVTLFLNLNGRLLKKESKLIGLITVVLIWMFIGGNTGTPDTVNYMTTYNRSVLQSYLGEIEIGYLFLEKIGNSLGLDYMLFRILSVIPCIFLLHSTIKKFSYNYHYVYFFYMLYAMIIDAEQIRNFMAVSIVIYSIKFLIGRGIKNKLKYLVCILIAASIHTTSIIYVMLLFIKNNKNRFIKITVSIIIALCLITIFNGNKIPFINIIIPIANNEKVYRYLTSITKRGFLYPVLLQLFNFAMMFWARKITHKYKNKLNISVTNFVDLIYWINFFAFSFVLFFIMNVQFYRLIRNFTILNLIVYSLVQKPLNDNLFKKLVFNFMVLVNTGTWFFFDFIVKGHIEEVVRAFFENNLFLGLIKY